jgi:hypothetical protein
VKLPGVLTMAGAGCLLGALAWVVTTPGVGDDGWVPTGRGGDRSDAAVPPTAVHIPGREDRIPVVSIGVSEGGKLEPPEDVEDVGWWRGGAALGDASGTVVLAGHVDAAAQGLGSFAALWHVKPGQQVHLGGEDGPDVVYRITGTRVYPRTRALPASVFDRGGTPKLALITCAGGFDRKSGHYSDTLVVYAVPEPAPKA